MIPLERPGRFAVSGAYDSYFIDAMRALGGRSEERTGGPAALALAPSGPLGVVPGPAVPAGSADPENSSEVMVLSLSLAR